MIPLRFNQRVELIACACFSIAFLSFLFIYGTAPISDPDFWWHLKTGQVMAQKGGLLQFDPFTFTGDGLVSAREAIILKGYWLWQIIAYELYSHLGFHGIFLLNLLTVGAMAGVVAYEMRRQEVDRAIALPLLALGFILFNNTYLLERPQIISFLFAAILLAILGRVRDSGRPVWFLPLLMMVWANLHGGFVVGDLILICFASGAVFEYRHDLPKMRRLLLWVGVGIAASLLNPNGGLVFGELVTFQNSELMSGVSEYQSTLVRLLNGHWPVVILWLLIVLYGIGIWASGRRYWPELLIALFLALFSTTYARNVGFFSMAMLPAIGFYLHQGVKRNSFQIPIIISSLLILMATACLLWQSNLLWQKQSKEGTVSSTYPEDSSQFILSSGLQGRMFNSYNFGGFQIWKLYPKHLVFIDGRGLDPDVYHDSKLITAASLKEVEGRKEFELLLDRYLIDYVVQPHVYYDTGRLTPLVKFLLVKPEWTPIYIDQNSYILARNTKKNEAVIGRYFIDKLDFNNKMIGYLTAYCKTWPDMVINHVALAEMLIFVGRYSEAEDRLAVVARLQPDNMNLPSLRNQLNVLRNAKKP